MPAPTMLLRKRVDGKIVLFDKSSGMKKEGFTKGLN